MVGEDQRVDCHTFKVGTRCLFSFGCNAARGLIDRRTFVTTSETADLHPKGALSAYLFIGLDEQNIRPQPRHRPVVIRAPQGIAQFEPQTLNLADRNLPQIFTRFPDRSGESQSVGFVPELHKIVPKLSHDSVRKQIKCRIHLLVPVAHSLDNLSKAGGTNDGAISSATEI